MGAAAAVLLAAALAGFPPPWPGRQAAPVSSLTGVSLPSTAPPTPPSALRGTPPPEHVAAPAPAQSGRVIVEIRFRGNYSIADEELFAAAGVQIGTPLTDAVLADIERRLRAHEGVGDVEVLERYRSLTATDEVVLLINVTEHVAVRDKLMFLPELAWTDEYGITFGARIATVDLLGLNERLAFPLTWGGERRAGAEVRFAPERALLSRLEAGFGILQRENPHFEVADRRIDGWLEAARRWRSFELGGRLRAEDVDFAGAEETQLGLGLSAALDTRQDKQLPRDAFYLSGAWDRLELLEREHGFDRFTADLRGYKTFIGRTILAAQAYYRGANGRLPDWERPYLGGAQTVRGYDAGALIGDNLALASMEWRVPITPPLPVGLVGLNFFFDTGAVYDWGTSIRKARFHNGVGGGVYLLAAFVGLQVDVAYGLKSDEVHLHFSTGFRF